MTEGFPPPQPPEVGRDVPGSVPEKPFHRLSPLTPLVRGAIFVVAVAATTWDDLLSGNLGVFAGIMLAVLLFGAVYGWASWLRTRYWIDDRELRIDTGVVYHQSRRIRIDRLQGIDIVQPFVARLFGLAELKMDVAGGDQEGSLAFLPLAEAHRVRKVLLERRDAVRRADAAEEGSGDVATESTEPPWVPPDHDIASLDLTMLALSTLLSPEMVLLLLFGLAAAISSLFVGGLVAAPGLPVIIGFGLVVFRRFSGYYGFTVSQTRAGLQVRRGLFERTTQTITLARVMGVVISEPVMWRPFGWAKLDVSLAGVGGTAESDGGPSASTVMPVAERAVIYALATHLLRGHDTDVDADIAAIELVAPPRRARWLDPLAQRFMGVGLGRDVVVARQGWFTRTTHAVRHARVQSVRLSQGPLQRRLRLADVHVDSPPGPVHVVARNRDAAEARRLWETEAELAKRARSAQRR